MCPPKPRYTHTRDVHLVTKYLACLGKTKLLPLKHLWIKLAMLFALSCPEQALCLRKLDLRHCCVAPEGVFFTLESLRKQGSPGQLLFFCLLFKLSLGEVRLQWSFVSGGFLVQSLSFQCKGRKEESGNGPLAGKFVSENMGTSYRLLDAGSTSYQYLIRLSVKRESCAIEYYTITITVHFFTFP